MKLQRKIWLGVATVIALIMAVDMVLGYRDSEAEVRRQLDDTARVVRAVLMSTRRVYHEQFLASGVPLNEKTLGFLPAHALSRISADFPHWIDSGLRFNNVSDQPRNPGNLADSAELAAMDWFRAHPTAPDRVAEIRDAQGHAFYHFTAPIWVEAYCLNCHGDRASAPPTIRDRYATAYGYRVGDLRGVMSIKLPLDELRRRTLLSWWQRFSVRLLGYATLLLLLGSLLQRLVIRRLARLDQVTQRLASGDLAVRARMSGSDEVSALAARIDDMAAAIGQHDAQVERLNRIYAALSETNQTIVRVDNEALLLERVGRIAVELGGMRMAWVGESDAEGQALRMVSNYGQGGDYIAGLALPLAAGDAQGGSPAARVWRSGQPLIVQDFFASELTQPWHERARPYGWGSSAYFPIVRGGRVRLVLSLYHAEKNAFDRKMQELLGEMAMDIGYALDRIDMVAEQRRLHASVRASEAKYHNVVTASQDGFWITDAAGRLLEVNDAYVRFSGYSSEELLTMCSADLDAGESRDSVDWHLQRTMLEGSGVFETLHRSKSGKLKPVEVSSVYSPADGGRFSVFIRDLSTRNEAEARIQRLSHFDVLTGLANRGLFLEQLEKAIAKAGHEGSFSAVLLLDLDRFKSFNEARGLAFGDGLLLAVGERLRALLHDDDVVARLDSDEFAIFLASEGGSREAAGRQALAVAEGLQETLLGGVGLGGETLRVEASIGIAIFPDTAEEHASDVVRQADLAMHQAKLDGGNAIVFFEAAMGETVRERFELERELRQGIAEGQLRLYLQPQVDAGGRQVGAEALVRWQHPQRGLLPPGLFIPLAESSDLIVALDRWVLTSVCQLLAELKRDGDGLRISVNVSPRHFSKSDFVAEVRQQLEASGADPHRLMLEVTEGLVIDNLDLVIAKMSALSALGIHFSMDDFGTGYSSLSYLKRLPIHELKIDKSFIQDAPTDANDAALVETILAVARLLHLQVVAEGVESPAQADFLNARGEVIHQGYLFGRPQPVSEWLAARRAEG
jgi:diguanylate cyclase (GGDEF)-like protein/PAS domain S-box-containing protein